MASEFFPTLFFGFLIERTGERLHQYWVTQDGKAEWRPVPYIQLEGVKRSDSIAGWVNERDH